MRMPITHYATKCYGTIYAVCFAGLFPFNPSKHAKMITRHHNDPNPQASLFQVLLRDIVNPENPLVKLANTIDWKAFEEMFKDCYCPDNGRPACPVRVMVGLQYLRAIEGISDQDVLNTWCENPY